MLKYDGVIDELCCLIWQEGRDCWGLNLFFKFINRNNNKYNSRCTGGKESYYINAYGIKRQSWAEHTHSSVFIYWFLLCSVSTTVHIVYYILSHVFQVIFLSNEFGCLLGSSVTNILVAVIHDVGSKRWFDIGEVPTS